MRQIGAMVEQFAAMTEQIAAMAEQFAAMVGFFGGIFPRPRRDAHGGWVARRRKR
jgi:methyl-accepting chemotaxis protein